MTEGKSHDTGDAARNRSGPQGTMVITDDDLPDAARRSAGVGSAPTAAAAALVGISEPFAGQQFQLAGTQCQIGRLSHNDIVLDDPAISWEHAQLEYRDGQWRVLNVLSTNGTFVNGEPVHEAALDNGDTVAFGRVQFRFQSDASEGSTAVGGARRSSRGWLVASATVIGGILVAVALLVR